MQTSECLNVLADQGIQHAGINASKILLDGDSVKVAGLGLAKLDEEHSSWFIRIHERQLQQNNRLANIAPEVMNDQVHAVSEIY